ARRRDAVRVRGADDPPVRHRHPRGPRLRSRARSAAGRRRAMTPEGDPMSGVPRELIPDYVEVRSPRAAWIAGRMCARAIERGDADFLFEGRPAAPAVPGSGRRELARFSLAGVAAVGKRAVHGGLFGPL